ncbi:MAG: ATP-binding protein [Rhodopila sp.]
MKLSTRLVLLVLGCLLPVLTAQIYSQLALHAARKDQFAAIALRQAAMADDDIGATVHAVGHLGTVLTQFSDAIATVPGCQQRLTALHANLPQYRFLGIYDPGGRLVCGSPSAPSTIGAEQLEWIRDVAGTKRVEAGLLTQAKPAASPKLLPIGTGLPSLPQGGGKAVLIAALDTDWFTHHLDAAQSAYLRPVPAADLVIVDRNGEIIARLSGGPNSGQASLPSWLMPLLHQPASGTQSVTDPQGNAYLAAIAPLTTEPYGVAAIETLTMTDVVADVDRATLQDLVVLTVAAATALLLAWIAGRRFIYAPTEALLQAARKWREGDLNARATLDDPGSEFTALAQSFNAMAAGLQVREIERELQASMLEARVKERTRALSESNNRLQVEIAGREKSEAALHQAQKLQAVGQLAGGIAHDFNNMLATVLGNLELIERRFAQPGGAWAEADRQRMLRLVGRASSAVQRGSRLTSRLLAFSRRQQFTPRATDITALLRDVITLAGSTLGSRIQIASELDEELWPAMADPSQVEAAVLNLCLNARDAMPDGGTVSITTGNLPSEAASRQDDTLHLPPGDYVRICVADTGCGMTAEVKARAFDPFFTTKGPSGTGLGLSQVYGMARQSGGDVTIQSETGQGARITLYLPRAIEIEEPALEAAQPVELITDRGGETALVVDDDHEVRQVTVEMLRHLGFSVREAEGGDEALTLVATVQPPASLFLVDYAMPGMNGLVLAQRLRERGVEAPIALVTGYAELSGAELAASEFCGVLHKPFTLQELQMLVAQVSRVTNGQRAEAVPNLV